MSPVRYDLWLYIPEDAFFIVTAAKPQVFQCLHCSDYSSDELLHIKCTTIGPTAVMTAYRTAEGRTRPGHKQPLILPSALHRIDRCEVPILGIILYLTVFRVNDFWIDCR
jgi:hypothetical protein